MAEKVQQVQIRVDPDYPQVAYVRAGANKYVFEAEDTGELIVRCANAHRLDVKQPGPTIVKIREVGE